MAAVAVSPPPPALAPPRPPVAGVFPPGVQKTLVSEVTAVLLAPPAPGATVAAADVLLTPAHVLWCMDVVGQGFALPIEESALITNCTAVYRRWLLDAQSTPASFVAHKQFFWQKIFHHFALLFHPRLPPRLSITTTPAAAAQNSSVYTALLVRHVDLCKSVLEVLLLVGRTVASALTEDTWRDLLTVLIDITDSLLVSSTTMADELCPHLLRVLVELWLRSQILATDMWGQLSHYFRRWVHRLPVIVHLSATNVALTQRVLRAMYGPIEGSTADVHLAIGGEGPRAGIDIPDTQFLYLAWHRFLNMIGDPTTLRPAVFSEAMQGIARLVDMFLAVDSGQTFYDPSTLLEARKSPDGNTILHILGHWLFRAATMSGDPDVEAGRAVALGSLCKLFSHPQRRNPFLSTYVDQFFVVFVKALREEPQALASVLLNSEYLFASSLPGLRVLIPPVVVALRRILPRKSLGFRPVVQEERLRRACIRILSMIIAVPNHFGSAPLIDRTGLNDLVVADPSIEKTIRRLYEASLQRMSEFADLRPHILALLWQALVADSSSANQRLLLQAMLAFVLDDRRSTPGLLTSFVNLLLDKLHQRQLGHDVQAEMLDILQALVVHHGRSEREDENACAHVSTVLCQFVALAMQDELALMDGLVTKAFDVLTGWTLAGTWAVASQQGRDVLGMVFAVIGRGMAFARRAAASEERMSGIEQESSKRASSALKRTVQPIADAVAAAVGAGGATGPSSTATSPVHQGGATAAAAPQLRRQHVPMKNSYTIVRERAIHPTVRDAAVMALHILLNRFGQFPTPDVGPERLSTLFEERAMAQEIAQRYGGTYQHWMRVFVIDERVVMTLVENPGAGSGPGVVCVLRDCTGAYSWRCIMRYRPTREREPPVPTPMPLGASNSGDGDAGVGGTDASAGTASGDGSDIPLVIQELLGIRSFTSDAMATVDTMLSQSTHVMGVISQLASRQSEREQVAARTSTLAPAQPAQPPQARELYPSEQLCRFQSGRMFLADTGLLHLENRERVTPVPLTQQSEQQLAALDAIPERICFAVSVLYGVTPDDAVRRVTELGGDAKQTVSNEFVQLLGALGWSVDLSEHKGYRGRLDAQTGVTAPYYSTHALEVLFHSPCLLPLRLGRGSGGGGGSGAASLVSLAPPDMPPSLLISVETISAGPRSRASSVTQVPVVTNLGLVTLVAPNAVHIVWLEDASGYVEAISRLRLALAMFHRQAVRAAFLVVQPLRPLNGLYLVRKIVYDSDLCETGPLLDGQVVGRHTLGELLRQTAIALHLQCASPILLPYFARRTAINELAGQYRSRDPRLSTFYQPLF